MDPAVFLDRDDTIIHDMGDVAQAPRVRLIAQADGSAVVAGPEFELADETVSISSALASEALPEAVVALLSAARP